MNEKQTDDNWFAVALGIFLAFCAVVTLTAGNFFALIVALFEGALAYTLLANAFPRVPETTQEPGNSPANQLDTGFENDVSRQEEIRLAWQRRKAEKKALEEERQRQLVIKQWDEYHRRAELRRIDEMDGLEFERFVATLFSRIGHEDIRLTEKCGDQGADLLCRIAGVNTAVQAKRWKASVGNSAVRDVLGAMLYYGCDAGVVIANRPFTESAKALAAKDDRITLIDREILGQLIDEYFPSEVPPFDEEDYRRHVVPWSSALFAATLRTPTKKKKQSRRRPRRYRRW